MKYQRAFLFLLMVLIMIGCSPRGHQVLCIFFDGVPDCEKKAVNNGNDTIQPGKRVLIASTLPVQAVQHYVIHPPYNEYKCDKCHDGGQNSNNLKDQPGICYQCHKDFKDKFKYVHGPVAGGYCTACHNGHKSVEANLLKRKAQQICLYCHTKLQVMKNTAHAAIGEDDCTKCHDPHGGSTRYGLK